MTVTARQRFGARPLRRREHPPKRVRRGETVDSPSASRFGTGGGNLTRCGCPSLKTKIWIARVGLNMLGQAAAHGAKATGSGPKCGMSHRIHKKRIPIRAFGEPKTKGSGTTRVVARSNHGGLLNPNRRWGFVRSERVGRPTRAFGISRPTSREVRRQRPGRPGQGSSSESKSSRGGLAAS